MTSLRHLSSEYFFCKICFKILLSCFLNAKKERKLRNKKRKKNGWQLGNRRQNPVWMECGFCLTKKKSPPTPKTRSELRHVNSRVLDNKAIINKSQMPFTTSNPTQISGRGFWVRRGYLVLYPANVRRVRRDSVQWEARTSKSQPIPNLQSTGLFNGEQNQITSVRILSLFKYKKEIGKNSKN